MLPVLNYKSTAHWHLGCCCICSLPCPSTQSPGDLRLLRREHPVPWAPTAAQMPSCSLGQCL